MSVFKCDKMTWRCDQMYIKIMLKYYLKKVIIACLDDDASYTPKGSSHLCIINSRLIIKVTL